MRIMDNHPLFKRVREHYGNSLLCENKSEKGVYFLILRVLVFSRTYVNESSDVQILQEAQKNRAYACAPTGNPRVCNDNYHDVKMEVLESMGFDSQTCRRALEMAGAEGLERAIELLLDGNLEANNSTSSGGLGIPERHRDWQSQRHGQEQGHVQGHVQGQGQGRRLSTLVLPVSQYTYIQPNQEGTCMLLRKISYFRDTCG